jgi:SEC-C motif-containing protein
MVEVQCPCDSGQTYVQCCEPYHSDLATAPTAEALMRSRYSAFVVCDAGYLLRTWHPRTRPRRFTLDENDEWKRLEILSRQDGGLFDTEGMVEFRAFYSSGGRKGVLYERSRFLRYETNWVYVGSEA